ncbi:dual specificity protein phosphatase 14-like [Schistocerca serialis cubense]|uniref:dual specificity protein phosphatase 14-like n=1 Tax=Schistocerca serialis cubense TaxID=2023355 RepID=UPI00214E975F|nr:dual specificity protein phosphatase 14-like [Schistocerca serialis cubense]
MKVLQEDVLKIEDADACIIAKDQNGLLRLGVSAAGESDNAAAGVSEVLPWLLVAAAAAVRPERVRALAVTRVLSAAPELPDTPLPAGVAFQRVALLDAPSEDLAPHLDAAADAIEQVRASGGRTLVHCVAGVSRSAALCLAHLVKHCGLPLRAAFAHLRARRPAARPSAAFFRQLIDFERAALGAASVAMVRHPAAPGALIPDVYEPDYRHTVWFQQHCAGRAFGRH